MRSSVLGLMALSLVLPLMSCRKSEPVQPQIEKEIFKGAQLNRRYQLPNIKSFVTLPEDWLAKVKIRPDWELIKTSVKSDDPGKALPVDSQLLFEARPGLEAWKPHMTRLEVFLDVPVAVDLTLNQYAETSALSTGDASVKVLHAEREQVRLGEQYVLSTRRDLEFKTDLPQPMEMRQYILHALVPIPELENQTVGLTFVLSATGLATLKGLKEKTLRKIMASLSFKKRS